MVLGVFHVLPEQNPALVGALGCEVLELLQFGIGCAVRVVEFEESASELLPAFQHPFPIEDEAGPVPRQRSDKAPSKRRTAVRHVLHHKELVRVRLHDSLVVHVPDGDFTCIAERELPGMHPRSGSRQDLPERLLPLDFQQRHARQDRIESVIDQPAQPLLVRERIRAPRHQPPRDSLRLLLCSARRFLVWLMPRKHGVANLGDSRAQFV